MDIKVLINGAAGRMGQETVKAVLATQGLTLVGKTDKNDDLTHQIEATQAQVVIDFTHPSAGFENTKTILAANARPVIGTTGFSPEQIAELQKIAQQKKLGGIVAPNFSIAAVLMMQYACDAAKYFPHVEIIEMHHDAKADSPSGTAIKTAEMIAAVKQKVQPKVKDKAILPNSRGALFEDIHIHAVRLPGIVADQQVIFGGLGETFTLSHRTINREAFMPGVMLACKKVLELDRLVYGLEEIL